MGSILKMAEDKKQKIMRVKQFQKTMQEEEMCTGFSVSHCEPHA